MTHQLAGFPHWEIRFDANGASVDVAEVERLVAEAAEQGIGDLFVFSHGWNNDQAFARRLYKRFFTEMSDVLNDLAEPSPRAARAGTVGIIWPSMRWADEAVPLNEGGGAASLSDADDAALVRELKKVFDDDEQQAALNELAALLDERPDDDDALRRFQELMATLTPDPDDDAIEDAGEATLVTDPARDVFDRFAAEVAPADVEGGAAGMGDVFKRLWSGAKEALRQATYWQMKKRAGVVGKEGLGPMIGELHTSSPDLRVHLVGHSFGARLVSFALAGLPAAARDPSPVKSLLLLQGAFSHFAFCDELPHDPSRSGALVGMASRVDGPIVVSHSEHDRAVGTFYPLASIGSGDDAAALSDRFYRWGAIGHDGAQRVPSTARAFARVSERYSFTAGEFCNLDGDAVIRNGGPPSGAHSDIFHPEIAWAAVSCSGLTD